MGLSSEEKVELDGLKQKIIDRKAALKGKSWAPNTGVGWLTPRGPGTRNDEDEAGGNSPSWSSPRVIHPGRHSRVIPPSQAGACFVLGCVALPFIEWKVSGECLSQGTVVQMRVFPVKV